MAPSPRIRRIIKWSCTGISLWVFATWILILIIALQRLPKPNPDGHEGGDMVFAASAGATVALGFLVLAAAIPTAWLWYRDGRTSA